MSVLDRLERAFSEYDVDPSDEAHAYFSSQDPKVLEGMFEAVRAEAARDDCFPLLLRREDDYAFYIFRNRPRALRPAWLPWLLLAATVATTVVAGALFAQGYLGAEDAFWSAGNLLAGAALFALPLLLVLGGHEAAHWLVARRLGLDVATPWFLPLPPPLSFMGTLGGVTDLRAPVPTRRALALFAASGPLAGFVLALLVLGVGLSLSASEPAAATEGIAVGVPLAMQLLDRAIAGDAAALHPVALAGWVGLFLTALHLLPAAGLDGGMLARALLGRQARWVGLATVLALVALAAWSGWWPWALIAAGLVVAGVVHPQPLNEVTPPGRAAWALGALCAVALALSFAVRPLG